VQIPHGTFVRIARIGAAGGAGSVCQGAQLLCDGLRILAQADGVCRKTLTSLRPSEASARAAPPSAAPAVPAECDSGAFQVPQEPFAIATVNAVVALHERLRVSSADRIAAFLKLTAQCR